MKVHQTKRLTTTPLLLLLTAISLTAVVVQGAVQATLVLPDTTLLPGVPFEMWIEIYNDSEETVSIGTASRAVIEPEAGEPFVIEPTFEHGTYPPLLVGWDGEGLDYADLAPHQKRFLTLPVDTQLAVSMFASDRRISAPGRYRISLVLDKVPRAPAPASFVGPVATNVVVMDRVRPSGIDALVWLRLQNATDDGWQPGDWGTGVSAVVGREIISDYRDSAYFPYAVLVTAGFEATGVALRLDAIHRFPKSPIIELLYAAAWQCPTGFAGSLANQYESVTKYVRDSSRRPTTKIMLFGRDDLGNRPCPPEHDCQ
jgi:hypothetical protein